MCGSLRAVTIAGIVASIVAGAQRVTWQALAAPVTAAARAPERLTDTGLYAPGRPEVIAAGNRAFSPQYPLWSDGATKRRWVYLPPGQTIDAADVNDWKLPVGTRFWKEFSFNGRKVETRFLWKAKAERWVAVSYAWNEEGTDAVLASDKGEPGVFEIASGRRHSIPSSSDCLACHGTRSTGPLGFNALQLSPDRDPNAIHGETMAAGMVTLQTLVEERRLSPARTELIGRPPRILATSPRTRAVLGYFAANCGGCHNASGEIATLGPSLKHGDVQADPDAVAASLVGHATTWQVPGVPEGSSVLIDTATPDSSAILVRMRSRRPSSQMPPLGTVIRDQAAIDAIGQWIATDLARERTKAADRRH